MRIVIDEPDSLARFAADLIGERVADKPDAVIGLATGSSPVQIYQELARRVDAGELDLSPVRFFALDEYVGLPGDHPQSYRYFLDEHVIGPCHLDPSQLRVLGGTVEDVEAECADYERAIAEAGGIDLQILGIGHNGHIAFNEPGTSLGARTHQVALTEETVQANARFFESADEVPTSALTQGIGQILEAGRLVLIATGTGKADAIGQSVEGPLGAYCPGTALQLHPKATFLVDAAAAGKLERADYYRRCRELEPNYGH